MKRKMLISIALITIMLLNCIMPIFSVYAETDEEIQLNSNLYKAVKSSLTTQGIPFTFDNITHTLTLSSESKSKITELNLNEGSISDLTGLEKFSSLTHLELSGNNITINSNLGVLNSLTNLNYLDLSSNQIEDVSAISALINNLKTKGTIILSGQNIIKVESVYVDSEEGSDNEQTATFQLPSILELAGYIKACWKSVRLTPQTEDAIPPSLSVDSIPMYVNSENNKISINICSESGQGYYGLVAVNIRIYDDATEAANAKNPNRASENILKDSEFKLYYVVFDKSSEAITTMDTNLYNAIKEQLTGGQTVNSELSSYPYAVDSNGNTIYEEYTYTSKAGNEDEKILTNNETKEIEYLYNTKTNTLYRYDGKSIGDFINVKPEPIDIRIIAADGTITTKAGYRLPFIDNEAGKDLYIAAYDDAKTFVISDLVLTNKITSLQLNNKQIRDLSGIENFMGLKSNLDVSHNYLSNIDPIYYLDGQKDLWEDQIVAKYTSWLNGRNYGNLSVKSKETKDAKNAIKTNETAIENAYKQILNILVSASEVSPTKEKYTDDLDTKAESISKILDSVYGSTAEDGKHTAGYYELITGYTDGGEYIDGAKDKLNENISEMYYYLGMLYKLYNNEYKLTTLLSDNVNYLTYDEYNAYKTKVDSTAENARALVDEEIAHLNKLEAAQALSELDKELLKAAFPGINFDSEKTETPVAEYFKEYLEGTPLNRVQAKTLLDEFRKIAIYSEMANYCLIKRMNEETASGYCYEQEYLEKRIKEFEIEDMPAEEEKTILEHIKENSGYNKYFNLYKKYTEKQYKYTATDSSKININTCKGKYIELADEPSKNIRPITVTNTKYNKNELITAARENAKNEFHEANVSYVLNKLSLEDETRIIKSIDLYENVYTGKLYTGEKNILFLYDQMMSLANKLLSGNIARYVTLARLKALNISYNADLENLSQITNLTTLYSLDSSYCYIADVTNVDWASMKNLKELSLAYNFISDISPLTNLENLRNLDVSNNLISGKLNITEQQYLKLFKRMENFNLSGNQINDIESLIIYLDYISGGDYANYLASENTLNIDLSNQDIEIIVNDPVILEEYPTTVNFELPKIFTQLLAIDTARTSLGVTSKNGRIESEGKYVTLNTRDEGEKTGIVSVIKMPNSDTCVGEGTTATIKYVVKSNKQDVNPETKVEYTIEYYYDNILNTNLTEKIEVEKDTVVTENTIKSNIEKNTSVGYKFTKVTLPTNNEKVIKVYYEKNSGTEDPTDVEYKIEYYYDNVLNSTLTEKIKLGKDEVITEGKLKAYIEKNTLTGYKYSSIILPITNTNDQENIVKIYYVKNNEPETPTSGVINTGDLGYTVNEDYLSGIKNKTPIDNFKTILLNGKTYDVVVLDGEGGKEVTSGFMKTGMLIRIEKDGKSVKDENGELAVYEVVVKGDINGDGTANSLDSNLIKAYRSDLINLEGAQKSAADINNDGKINVTDSKLLLYHRAEVNGYDLNFSK